MRLIWFRRPGIASALMPMLGMAQEWMTSDAVTRTRVSVLRGRTARLSTSRRRNSPDQRSSEGIIKESNSRSAKSEYSYLQYHWWPVAFIVRAGCVVSSMR